MIFLGPEDIRRTWSASQRSHEAATRMEDAPVPPSSLVHAGIIIGKAHSHYMDMVQEEREDKFQEAHADQA